MCVARSRVSWSRWCCSIAWSQHWCGRVPPRRSLAVRAATVRVAPGRTLYLIVGPINTQVPPLPNLLDEYRLRRTPDALWIELAVANTQTHTVTTLVSWRLPLRLLAVLPLGASLVLLIGTRRAHHRRPSANWSGARRRRRVRRTCRAGASGWRDTGATRYTIRRRGDAHGDARVRLAALRRHTGTRQRHKAPLATARQRCPLPGAYVPSRGCPCWNRPTGPPTILAAAQPLPLIKHRCGGAATTD